MARTIEETARCAFMVLYVDQDCFLETHCVHPEIMGLVATDEVEPRPMNIRSPLVCLKCSKFSPPGADDDSD